MSDNSTDAQTIQEAINNANPGDIIILDSLDFRNVSQINITKDISIIGKEGSTIFTNGFDVIFSILPKSEGGPDNITISNIVFKLNNGDTVVLAKAENISNSIGIDVSSININNNSFESVNDDVVAESITILKLLSEGNVLSPNNNISISGNVISAGMNPFEFKVTGIGLGDDINIGQQNFTLEKKGTVIHYENMNTVAVDQATDGRVGEYFNFKLTDAMEIQLLMLQCK